MSETVLLVDWLKGLKQIFVPKKAPEVCATIAATSEERKFSFLPNPTTNGLPSRAPTTRSGKSR